MSYHETFWVTVGAAAPIIALAAVVAFTDTGHTAADWERDHPKAGKRKEDLEYLYLK